MSCLKVKIIYHYDIFTTILKLCACALKKQEPETLAIFIFKKMGPEGFEPTTKGL